MKVQILSTPLIHSLKVCCIALNDEVRTLLLVFEFFVGQYAGEFEDAVVVGVQTAHFEIDPKECRFKRQSHLANKI
jgi:hypothetical protein